MRIPTLSVALAILAATLAAPLATAQSDACDQASPCPWAIDVDETGLSGDTVWNYTLGDWFNFTVFNLDEVAHTVTISGYDAELRAEPLVEAFLVIHLTKAGTFVITDKPTGQTGKLVVVDGDVVDYEEGLIAADGSTPTDGLGSGTTSGTSGATTGKANAPGAAALLAIAGLAIGLFARRHK